MTHRFSFACCVAPAFALLAAAPGPAAAQGYTGYPYSIMTPEPGSAKRHQGITAVPPQDARTPHEPAASATAALPTPGPCGARLIRLGVADAVAADAAHSAGRPERPGGACAAAGTAADRGARPRSANSQPAARSRDIPGPRVALRVPAKHQRRAGNRKQPLHGRVPAMKESIPGSPLRGPDAGDLPGRLRGAVVA